MCVAQYRNVRVLFGVGSQVVLVFSLEIDVVAELLTYVTCAI